MDVTQQNYLILGILLAAAATGALVVGVLSSQSLREEGLRRLIKRWLRR
jgi:Mn2+/Fe2+ NRAMP family transporter